MRILIILWFLIAVASDANAAGLSDVLCAPYESSWAGLSSGTDVDRLQAAAQKIPAQCAVHARALTMIAALKAEAARPKDAASTQAKAPESSWPSIGADLWDLNATLAAPLGLTGRQGAYVAFVDAGLTAAAGGLLKGDVVIAANNVAIASGADLVNVLKRSHVGDLLGLVVLRGAQTIVINLRLTAPPPELIDLRQGLAAVARNNYVEAARLFQASASAGNADAQFYLGQLYEYGAGVAKSYSIAMKLYSMAANQKYPQAEDEIGMIYNAGSGVDQNYPEAMRWYRLAAAQGYAQAQFHIGNFYYEGISVDRDYSEARRWYQLAAGQGDAEAENNLGVLYNNGEGVKVDQVEAVYWFQLAAVKGNSMAQYNLALNYASGRGVARNMEQARAWMTKAADDYDAAKAWLKNNP